MSREKSQEKFSYLLLRAGLAFSFIYAAIRAFLDPSAWIGWFPAFLQEILPSNVLLTSWGIVEVIIGIWILSGKKIFIPSLLASLSLFGLVAFNLGAMDIIFRDVSLALVALSLAIANYKR